MGASALTQAVQIFNVYGLQSTSHLNAIFESIDHATTPSPPNWHISYLAFSSPSLFSSCPLSYLLPSFGQLTLGTKHTEYGLTLLMKGPSSLRSDYIKGEVLLVDEIHYPDQLLSKFC